MIIRQQGHIFLISSPRNDPKQPCLVNGLPYYQHHNFQRGVGGTINTAAYCSPLPSISQTNVCQKLEFFLSTVTVFWSRFLASVGDIQVLKDVLVCAKAGRGGGGRRGSGGGEMDLPLETDSPLPGSPDSLVEAVNGFSGVGDDHIAEGEGEQIGLLTHSLRTRIVDQVLRPLCTDAMWAYAVLNPYRCAVLRELLLDDPFWVELLVSPGGARTMEHDDDEDEGAMGGIVGEGAAGRGRSSSSPVLAGVEEKRTRLQECMLYLDFCGDLRDFLEEMARPSEDERPEGYEEVIISQKKHFLQKAASLTCGHGELLGSAVQEADKIPAGGSEDGKKREQSAMIIPSHWRVIRKFVGLQLIKGLDAAFAASNDYEPDSQWINWTLDKSLWLLDELEEFDPQHLSSGGADSPNEARRRQLLSVGLGPLDTMLRARNNVSEGGDRRMLGAE